METFLAMVRASVLYFWATMAVRISFEGVKTALEMVPLEKRSLMLKNRAAVSRGREKFPPGPWELGWKNKSISVN